MTQKTVGQAMIERLAAWIGGYLFLPDPDLGLVLALWAVNTWVFERFNATPYLAITAATKRAGKTLCAELLTLVSQNGRLFSDPTPSTMFRILEMFDGKMTLGFDEAESLAAGRIGSMRSFQNSGYRKGQTLPRTMPGGKVQEFGVFCPKLFVLIGDVNDTLRDRSIVAVLKRGTPERRYQRDEAEIEAAELVSLIRSAFAETLGPLVKVAPGFLQDRDYEIWEPLFSLASFFGLERGLIDRLTRVAADMVVAKTEDARIHTDYDPKADEQAAMMESYGERAMADLKAVFKEGERYVLSGEAVARMQALVYGPWRKFRGKGLDENLLARLLSPFGIKPRAFIQKDRSVRSGYGAESFGLAFEKVKRGRPAKKRD